MNVHQLELFQNANEYERQIFLNAKKLKLIVQKLYGSLDNFFNNNSDEFLKDFCILKIGVTIDQISDNEMKEPSSPKMFIWKFLPSITFRNGDGNEQILKEGESLNNEICPKIIPKWANELFTSKTFSHGDFLQITIQYFTLEMALKVLESKDIMSEILGKIDKKKLIICFDSKLFPNTSLKAESVEEFDIVNRIGNLFTKLKNIQKENWYYLGQYDDFTKENNFLLELDNNEVFIGEKAKEESLKGTETLAKIYNNDFLFLNNAEFFHQKKSNTDSWDNNYILPPSILDRTFSKIDESSTYKKSNQADSKRNLFYYRKKGAGECFFRSDILLPNNDVNSNQLLEIILVTEKLKED